MLIHEVTRLWVVSLIQVEVILLGDLNVRSWALAGPQQGLGRTSEVHAFRDDKATNQEVPGGPVPPTCRSMES